MPRFFISQGDISGGRAVIKGDDAKHIGRSLRMKPGERLTLSCLKKDYLCKIISISESEVVCGVESCDENKSEPDIEVTLFQAYPKSDKMEFIIQKSVELGAVRIVPVITKRCVSRPDKKSFEKKAQRLRKIALEAAKQSGRGIIPEVSDIISFDDAVKELSKMDKAYVCYENGGESFCENAPSSGMKIGLFIGSEGGFESFEIDILKDKGFSIMTLGPRILRCETAPISALSIIMALSKNM